VPVVASPAAVAGLEVSDGRHLLVAEDAEQMAAAVAAVATDDALATRLVDEAAKLVQGRYSTEAVIPAVRDFVGRRGRRDSRPLQSSGAV
jgi:glycosyltransferase involved in cell wall biosynthesis